jgi:hypothetical protein
MTKNCEILQFKNKFIFFDKKLQYIYPYASMKDVQATGGPPALKIEHPALQKMEFLNFFFLLFVVPFCPAGSRSGSNRQNNQCESGSTTLPKIMLHLH